MSEIWKVARRLVERRPLNSIATVIILAMALALVLPTYSLRDGALDRGLPVPNGKRIVALSSGASPLYPSRIDDFAFLAAEMESLEELAAFRSFNTSVTPTSGVTEVLHGSYVSHNTFSMLGVEPRLGRPFDAADALPSQPDVAAISYDFWQRRFGGDPGVLGSEIIVNRAPASIVAVMPRDFAFPIRQDIWGVLRAEGRSWSKSGVFVIGRLPAEGEAAMETARAEFTALVPALNEALPNPTDGSYPERQAYLASFVESVMDPGTVRALRLMTFASLFVFLAACVNVAQLRAASALGNLHQTAIRRSLGASTFAIVREHLLEVCLLVLAAASLGLLASWAVIRVLGDVVINGSPLQNLFWVDLRLDTEIIALALGLALAGAALGGLLPALLAAREGKKVRAIGGFAGRASGSKKRAAIAKTFIASEVALTLVLLAGTAVMVRASIDLLQPRLGFNPDNLASAVISSYHAEWQSDEEAAAFSKRFIETLNADPEVTSAAWGNAPWHSWTRVPMSVEGETWDTPSPTTHVQPGAPIFSDMPRVKRLSGNVQYLETVGLELLYGQRIEPRDHTSAPGDEGGFARAMVSKSLAEDRFGGQPLGKTFTLHSNNQQETYQIVGVVADLGTDHEALVQNPEHAVFTEGRAQDGGLITLRTRTGRAALAPIINRAIAKVDRRVGSPRQETFDQAFAAQTWVQRSLTQAFSTFGLATLILVIAGIYALLSSMVHRRTREFGIRTALGALPRNLRQLVLSDLTTGLTIGLLTGTAICIGLARYLEPVALGYHQHLATAVAIAALLLLAASLLASLKPLRRATRIDPADCMRAE